MEDQIRFERARKVTWIGMILNVILSSLKLLAGIVGHSEALVADAAHSFSDFATDIALLIGLKIAARPEDETHPYGHGRVETLMSLLMGLALVGVAIGIGWNAAEIIYEGKSYHPQAITAVMALVSVIMKEWLYRHTFRVGQEIDSPPVIANAWEHRSDAFSSLVAMLGIGIAILNPAWFIVEPLAAVAVSFLVLRIGGKIAWEAISELVDTAAHQEVCQNIELAAKEVTGVANVHGLKTRHVGRNILADVHIEVSPRLSVTDSHYISTRVQETIQNKIKNVANVQVHVEPEGERLREIEPVPPLSEDIIEGQIQQAARSIAGILGLHGLKIHKRGPDLQIDIDIEVDPQIRVGEGHELAKKLRQAILQINNVKEVMVHVDVYKGKT